MIGEISNTQDTIDSREIFEEIEKTGVLRDHRYITEGTIRQDETHYPERCPRCRYQSLKDRYKERK